MTKSFLKKCLKMVGKFIFDWVDAIKPFSPSLTLQKSKSRVTRLGDFSLIGLLLQACSCKNLWWSKEMATFWATFLIKLIT